MEQNPGYYDLLKQLLTSPQPKVDLPDDLRDRLLQSGAIHLLTEEGSDSAVDLLEDTVRGCPVPQIATQALNGIRLLSMQGVLSTKISLFRLALEDGNPDAVNVIQTENLDSPLTWQNCCFSFLHHAWSVYQSDDRQLDKLLDVFLTQASPVLQDRIGRRAQELGLVQWSQIARALRSRSEASLAEMITEYHGYTQYEKSMTRTWLTHFALEGVSPAQNALCELFLHWNDTDAARDATKYGFLPTEIDRRALFLFLTGQWDAYEILDFSHRHLITAYESGSLSQRQRLLSHSRTTGHTDWLQNLGEIRRRRWLADMTDEDWLSVVKQIAEQQTWNEAWRLVAHAPPLWSGELIELLFRSNWQASTESDQQYFLTLVALEQHARKKPPEVVASKILKAPAQETTATAIRADGQVLASGGTDNRIYLWNWPSGERHSEFISSPTSGTRALALSPDGLYLAAAFSDQAIRVFRLDDLRLVKTLEGHSALVRSLFFHPDGRTLFSCSFDGTLRAWRFPLGPESRRIAAGMGELFAMAGSAEGDRLVLAGSQVQVWRWPSCELIQSLPFPGNTILQLSRAGENPLISGVDQNQVLYLWNDTSGRLIQRIDTDSNPISSIALSPRGDFLLSGGRNGSISIWNAFTREKQEDIFAHEKPITSLHWASNTSFFSTSQDSRLVFWDARLTHWIRQPLDRLTGQDVAEIRALDRQKSSSPPSQAWIALLNELIQFRNRFDILLEEPGNIRLSEFDIEL